MQAGALLSPFLHPQLLPSPACGGVREGRFAGGAQWGLCRVGERWWPGVLGLSAPWSLHTLLTRLRNSDERGTAHLRAPSERVL